MPTVSVIIPTHNAGHYVVQAVQSALAQTYQDIEVIVVDDGSTDDTADRLLPLMSRICYVYQQNQERSVARNTGISLAHGEHIAFLDADDYWHPAKLEKQLVLLQQRSELGMVYCHIQCVLPNGVPVPLNRQLQFPDASDTDLFPHLAFRHFMGCSSSVVRRSVCDELGGFDPHLRYVEDWDFNFRVAARYPIGCVAEFLTYYRQYPGNTAQRAARYNVQDVVPAMIERNLDQAGAERCTVELRSHAMANAWWLGAKLDYAIGQPLNAQQRFARGLGYDREYLLEPNRFVEDVVDAALGLAGIDVTPVDEAQAFIETVFAHLPPDAVHLRKLKRQALGRLHAGYLFSGGSANENMPLWRQGLLALAHDPRWARNLGLWSIVGQSLVGQRVASTVRNVLRPPTLKPNTRNTP